MSNLPDDGIAVFDIKQEEETYRETISYFWAPVDRDTHLLELLLNNWVCKNLQEHPSYGMALYFERYPV